MRHSKRVRVDDDGPQEGQAKIKFLNGALVLALTEERGGAA